MQFCPKCSGHRQVVYEIGCVPGNGPYETDFLLSHWLFGSEEVRSVKKALYQYLQL